MKFQNPGFKFFWNGRTNGRTNERTNGRTSRKQYAPHFFNNGGIIKAIDSGFAFFQLHILCFIINYPLSNVNEARSQHREWRFHRLSIERR